MLALSVLDVRGPKPTCFRKRYLSLGHDRHWENRVNAPRAGRREWIGLAVIALPCLLYSMDLTVLHNSRTTLTCRDDNRGGGAASSESQGDARPA